LDSLTEVKISNLTTLMVDPTNICNFKCKTCPHGNEEILKKVNRPTGMMSLKLFKKIINDVSSVVKLKRLVLYKDGEPLINPALVEMVKYARKKMPFTEIDLSTNGSLLSREISIELINAGLDWIRISLQGLTDEDYVETVGTASYRIVSKNALNFFHIRNALKKNKPRFVVQLLKTEKNLKRLKEFRKKWQNNADELLFSDVASWDGTLGIVPPEFSFFSKQQEDRSACLAPWHSLAVNWNGLVSVCCVDWAFNTIVGDFNSQSLVEIWNGEKIKKFRQMHLNHDFSNASCKNCTSWKIFPKCLLI